MPARALMCFCSSARERERERERGRERGVCVCAWVCVCVCVCVCERERERERWGRWDRSRSAMERDESDLCSVKLTRHEKQRCTCSHACAGVKSA